MAAYKQEISDTNATRWDRVRRRLRVEVGDDVYSSWFARMEIEDCDHECVKLSVPTRFLRNWIQSHYTDRLISLWRNETPTLKRIDLIVRSAMRGPMVAPSGGPSSKNALGIRAAATVRTVASGLMITSRSDKSGGSPLDPRLSFSTFLVGRSNALAHSPRLPRRSPAEDGFCRDLPPNEHKAD